MHTSLENRVAQIYFNITDKWIMKSRVVFARQTRSTLNDIYRPLEQELDYWRSKFFEKGFCRRTQRFP